MSRYYTRLCNLYYGNSSKKLVNRNKTIPLNNFSTKKQILEDILESNVNCEPLKLTKLLFKKFRSWIRDL